MPQDNPQQATAPTDRRGCRFTIQPNAALRRAGWHRPLVALVLVSLLVALRFAWLGYWVILPFTVLELALLLGAVRLIMRREGYMETITVGNQTLEIAHSQPQKNRHWRFPTYWTQVRMQPPRHHWYPHRLLIGYRSEWVEVGRCLLDQEREALANALRRQVRHAKSAAFNPS